MLGNSVSETTCICRSLYSRDNMEGNNNPYGDNSNEGSVGADVIDPHVIRSLNKSELRKRVLFYLKEIHPNFTYLSELARNVRSDPSNVLGSLKGMGDRYNSNSSLIELGLVEMKEKGDSKYYRLSDHGKEIVDMLEDYYSV